MKNEDFSLLSRALDYASSKGSFNKVNLIEAAENVCVFGVGTYFREAFVSKNVKEKYKVNLLSDNDATKWGKEFEGIVCVPPEELLKYKKLIVIIMLGEPLPVQTQLDLMGITWVTHVDLSLDDIMGVSKEQEWFQREIPKIKDAFELFEDEESRKIYVNALCNRIAYPLAKLSWKEMFRGGEYFCEPFMKLDEHEVYVDCGAYDGDTVLAFMNVVRKYQEIHAFEMDRQNYHEMEKVLGGKENVFLYNKGVWRENKVIAYGRGSGSSEPKDGISIMKANDGDPYIAKTVKLDDLFREKRVTFIKMDIEGAEIPALYGAQEIIEREHPKLAICVYHKTSDLWEIPLLIKQFGAEYRLKLGHHAIMNCVDTVLYGC